MSLTSKEYEPTGIFSVDMVAAAVDWHFRNHKPLKTIYLKSKYFNEFKSWAKKQYEKLEGDIDAIEKLEFEHVEIKEGSKLLVFKDDIYFDFWINEDTDKEKLN